MRRLDVPAGVQEGELQLTWDGSGGDGTRAAPGAYTVQVDAVSSERDLTQSASTAFELTVASAAPS